MRSYPHNKYTMGFAGRGGGNAFYINTENNTSTHGPGSDRGGRDPEADTVFGAVVDFGKNRRIVDSMRRQPGGSKPNGFIDDKTLHIDILSLKLLSSQNCSSLNHNKYSSSCRALDAAAKIG